MFYETYNLLCGNIYNMTMRLMLLADNKNRVKDEKIHFNIQPG